MAPIAENTIQMDSLVDNLTVEELSHPEGREPHTQSLKRSRNSNIREFPVSNEEDYEEAELQSHLPKKAKTEGISAHFDLLDDLPAYLDTVPEPTISERLARMVSHSLPARTKYNACNLLPANTRKIRPFHHDTATVPGFQIDMKAVIAMLRTEIQAYNLDVSNMVLERFSHILQARFLRHDNAPQQFETLKTLFVQPMLVGNTDLNRILRLKSLKRENLAPKSYQNQEHLFYIRSWTFTSAELYTIADSMQRGGCNFPELDEWKFASFMARLHNLTVRYVGTTTRDALNRFSRDLRERSKGNLLASFQTCVEQTYPRIFNSAEIYLLPDMSLEKFGGENNIGSRLQADDMESLLILLFGFPSLANSQLGGHHIRYLPNDEDERIFEGLGTKHFRNFLTNCNALSEEKSVHISSIFAALPADESLKDVLTRQATPYQYRGTTPMVFLGEEPSVKHFTNKSSFFDGPSKVSRLIRNFIYRIKNIEGTDAGDSNTGPLQGLSKVLPFVNTIPLPNYDDKANCLEMLTAYFECTQPIIVVTFGKKAASAMISNLSTINHQFGDLKNPLSTLAKYELAIRSYGPDKNVVFIHVPLEHPGHLQYGPRSPLKIRGIYLSIQFAFLVASCAVEVIEAHSKNSQLLLRKALCKEILTRVKNKVQRGIGSIFRSNREQANLAFTVKRVQYDMRSLKKNFDILEREYSKWIASQITQGVPYDSSLNSIGRATSLVSISQRARNELIDRSPSCFIKLMAIFGNQNSIELLNEENFRRISSFGVAVGEAYSYERQQDLYRVWNRNQKELHFSIPHLEENKNVWISQFMSLQPGQLYFLRALSQLEDDCDYLPALLGDSQRPAWYPVLPRMVNEREVLLEAVVKCGFWVQRTVVKPAAPIFPSGYLTAREMQGFPIGIKDNGEFVIRWKHPDGSDKNINLSAQFAAPQSSRDSRALSFTEHGVDIVDASGEPLRSTIAWNGGNSKATFPKNEFVSRRSGQLLLDLWKTVREEHGHKIEETVEGRTWGPKGQKHLSSSATEKQIAQQNYPPLENDANFLLMKFLDERFPEGGIFRTAPREKVLNSTEDLQAFVEFCRRPEYVNHPYSSKWCALLDRDQPVVRDLGKNFQILRECEIRRTNEHQSHLGKNVGEVTYNLGPMKSEQAFAVASSR